MTWFQRKREAIVLKTEKFEIVVCFKCLRHHLVFEHKWWMVKLTSQPTTRQHVMDTGSTFFLRGSRTWHSIIHYLPANIANNTLTRPSAEAKISLHIPSLLSPISSVSTTPTQPISQRPLQQLAQPFSRVLTCMTDITARNNHRLLLTVREFALPRRFTGSLRFEASMSDEIVRYNHNRALETT
jgi:hypothetical protein